MPHNPNIQKRPYSLKPYDPEWPRLFERYAATIKDILGDQLLEIHHLGSTSVPGMFAKPNIDVYALATSLDGVRARKDQMAAAGFTPRGDYSGIGEEYFTLDKPDGERIASVHIFEGSNKVFEPYINFRDYLISHPEQRDRYIARKKELHAQFADDYPAYDEGKQTLIRELIEKANTWANQRDN